jgi:hypothetical protein
MDTFDVKLYFLDNNLRDVYPLILNYMTMYSLIKGPQSEYHMCDTTIQIKYDNCNHHYYNTNDHNYILASDIKCIIKLYECFMNELLWKVSKTTFKEYLYREFKNSLWNAPPLYKSFAIENHYISLIVKYVCDRLFIIEHNHIHTYMPVYNIFFGIFDTIYSTEALKMTQTGTKWHHLISFDARLGKLLINLNNVSYNALFDVLPTELVI